MSKIIYKYEDITKEIKEAVDMIADPVRQTLSPMGSNVLYEDSKGDQYVTNDGVTIAKNIIVENPIHNAVIEIIKQPALQTNNSVGDGTTTTILLSQVAIHEGMKMIEEGMNRMVLKHKLEEVATEIKKHVQASVKKIESPSDTLKIAEISANNDPKIAKDVARVIEVAGVDGMVFIEPNHKAETELIEETGFNIETPLNPELVEDGAFTVQYQNIPVLITDKRLYYKEEAETILRTAIKAGWNQVAIVARDFIGQAPNYFIANHKAKNIRVLLIKDTQATETDSTSLHDLSAYLGGSVFTDKSGKIVDNLKVTDFVFAKRIVANPVKTILITDNNGKALKERIKNIRQEIEDKGEDKKLKKRLSSLTNGTVTIKVGGRTPIEAQEKMFRYEDSVNATRAAIKDGYLIGGGMALFGAYEKGKFGDMKNFAKHFCQASIKQIAENCGKHYATVLENVNSSKGVGYNAKTDKYSDLIKDGVIDPAKVTLSAVDNAISIAVHLLTSGYLVLNDVEKLKENNK